MSVLPTLQFPYREERHGYWGEVTSTLNWCEEDYNLSYYCAEVVNTLTNLTFIWLGIKGLRNVIKYNHRRVFIVAWLGYLTVGIGSMAFHASLKYSMQLADELPMIYTVCVMGFATFSHKRSTPISFLIGTGFVGVATFITVYYLYAKDPVFHQVAYAVLTLSLVFKSFYDMAAKLRPALEKRNPAQADQLMTEMWKIGWSGILMFLFGFFLWGMDNIFCRHLINARNHILLPWAVVLEGHAWWHIWTGWGAYHMIIWRTWLSRCLDGDEGEFMLHWPSLITSMPEIVPRPGQATQNGRAKKLQ